MTTRRTHTKLFLETAMGDKVQPVEKSHCASLFKPTHIYTSSETISAPNKEEDCSPQPTSPP